MVKTTNTVTPNEINLCYEVRCPCRAAFGPVRHWIDLDLGIWSFSGAWSLDVGAFTTVFDKRLSTGIFSPALPQERRAKRSSYAS
jgi:hypothetical protein